METLRHLFIQSEVAISVWKCFGEIFRIPFNFRSITQAMTCWIQYCVGRIGVAAYIFLVIRVIRCRANFECERMSTRAICLKVIYRVQLLTMVHAPKRASFVIQSNTLNLIGVSQNPIQTKRGRWVKWDKPFLGWFKLNIAGSARAGIITGGGVVQNFEGEFIAGFSNY